MLCWSGANYGFSLTFLSVSIYKSVHGPIQHHQYTFDGFVIDSVDNMSNLGVIIDSDVKFHSHVNSAVSKVNRILSLISKSFVNLSTDIFIRHW